MYCYANVNNTLHPLGHSRKLCNCHVNDLPGSKNISIKISWRNQISGNIHVDKLLLLKVSNKSQHDFNAVNCRA